MKFFILVFVTLGLMGCGAIKRTFASFTGDATEYCIEGVSYLQFPSGATVQYNTDGTVRACPQ